MKRLIKNIACLAGIDPDRKHCLRGSEMATLNCIHDAWMLIDGDRFDSWGKMADRPATDNDCEIIDAQGGTVLPSWCDSHTHIVYAGSREGEFVDKIRGLS